MAASGVQPIQKPEVKRVTKALTELEPFYCEKRKVYQDHSDKAATVFESARQGRGNLSAVYEARSKLISDQIWELKAENDRRTKEILDNLKQFSNSFEEGLAQRTKSWKWELRAGKTALQKRGAAEDAELVRASDLIAKEHEDTIQHTQNQIGPLQEQLKEHRRRLDETEAARNEAHEAYCTALTQSFKRLREALADEGVTRTEECEKTIAAAHESYNDLKAKTATLSDCIVDDLKDVDKTLKVEKDDTSNSNTWITHEMMKFMAHFEGSVNESLEKQEASKQYLLGLKTNFNPTT